MFHDYQDMIMQDMDNLPRSYLMGNVPSMLSNRVSHFFDLRGPSVTVDTACSTAMTALHLACQSIRVGDSTMAIVGGSNLILYPSSSIGLSTVGLTGPSGKSFSFDSRAEGYGRGEGVGCLVLKPLHDAIRDNDPIRAVIRETGMNQDGFTPTITSPSQSAQERLIRSCYAKAGLSPFDTAYVESHGTGTIAGDTVEVNALGSVFGTGMSAQNPIYIGSIKANFGHTEAASGIAAVIKVVQMLENDAIPPQALFSTPNPKIDFKTLNVKVSTSLIPWPEHRLRRVSVNNFGAGGSNTHAIIESPKYHVQGVVDQEKTRNGANSTQVNGSSTINGFDPGILPINGVDRTPTNEPSTMNAGPLDAPHGNGFTTTQDNGPRAVDVGSTVTERPRPGSNSIEEPSCQFLVPISTNREEGVRQVAQLLKDYLDSGNFDIQGRFLDLVYTLSLRRSHLTWRAVVSAESVGGLQEALGSSQLTAVQVPSLKKPRLGFVFTGQGAQWNGMGRELLLMYPVVRDAILEAQNHLDSVGASWKILDELFKDEASNRLDQPFLSFPCTVILQLALVRLLASWGITPKAVTGHSSGEISAAFAAEYITFEEAVAIAYWRGKITSEYVESGQIQGGMTALGLGSHDAEGYLADLNNGSAVIACINSPSSVTIAGDITALEEIETQATANQVFNRRLKVPAAYHSPQMEHLSDEYGRRLSSHLRSEPQRTGNVIFSSPVTGCLAKDNQSLRLPHHWVQNMVQVVKFENAIKALVLPEEGGKSPVDILIEVGPHGALQGAMRQILVHPSLKMAKVSVDKSLERGKNAVETMQNLAGRLHLQGYPIKLGAINFPQGQDKLRVVTDIPPYPWNHTTKYSAASSRAREALRRGQPPHDLLGVQVPGIGPGINIWRKTILTTNLPWLQHHTVQSEVLFPAAGMVTMVMDAMNQLMSQEQIPPQGYKIIDLELYNGAVVPSTSHGLDLQLALRDRNAHILECSDTKEFSFQSQDENDHWVGHCSGKVIVFNDTLNVTVDKSQNASNLTPIDVSQFYTRMQEVGPNLGPSFQNISSIAGGNRRAEAIITVPDIRAMLPYPHESEFWIHPTVFDACLQVAWAAVPQQVMCKFGTCVPRFAKSVFVAAGANLPPGSQLRVLASLTCIDSQGFEVSLHGFQKDEGQKLVMQVDGLRVRSLSRPRTSKSLDNTILRPVWTADEMSLEGLLGWGSFNNRAASYDKDTILISLSGPESYDDLQWLAESLSNSTGTNVCIGSLRSQQVHDKLCIIVEDSRKNSLSSFDAKDFENLKRILLDAKGVLWVSQQPQSSVISPEAAVHIGLLRTLRAEVKSTKYVSLVVSSDETGLGQVTMNATCDTFSRTVGSSKQDDNIYEVFHQSGEALSVVYEGDSGLNEEFEVLCGRRLARGSRPWFSDEYLYLTVQQPGMLDSLEFEQCDMATNCPNFTEDMVEIVPHAFGLNFRDMLVAMGEMNEKWMGFECAGYVSRAGSNVPGNLRVGSRVCCLMQLGHWANIVRVPWTSVVPIAESMSFELAASIPMCFVTAFYSLVTVGQLEAGETVMIHAAAGGVGQAAIAIAQSIGAEIFATVGSPEKEAFLTENYGIQSDKIFTSRNSEFRNKIMHATGGRGVDVVLNSLAGPLLQAGWECLAECGRFVELGKRDARRRMALQMEKFANPASYIAVDIVQLGIHKPKVLHRAFESVMAMFENNNITHKMPITSYSKADLTKALRQLQSGTNIGKIVINIQPDEQVQTILRSPKQVSFDPRASYLITGGVGGLGLEIVRWMSKRGAKHLVLMSRNAASPENAWIRDEFQATGTEIYLCSCDVTNKDALEQWIRDTQLQFPIQGVIQAAAVLRDAMFENMAHQQWQEGLNPKINGTRNLHELFQQDSLKFFITLSSATAVLGNAGQSNYTAGGAYQDALAHLRVSLRLPGVSINLGAVLSAGMAARSGITSRLGKTGYHAHDISEVLHLVELAVRHPYYGQMITGIKPWSSVGDLTWRLEPRFAALRVQGGEDVASERSEAPVTLKDRLLGASDDEGTTILADELKGRLAETFDKPANSFNTDAPLSSYGIDSLVAVELRNWIMSNVTSKASVFDITQSACITDLARKLMVKFAGT